MTEAPSVQELIDIGWMGGSSHLIHQALNLPLPDHPFLLFEHTAVLNKEKFHQKLIIDALAGPKSPRQTFRAFGKTIRRLLVIDFAPLTEKQKKEFRI